MFCIPDDLGGTNPADVDTWLLVGLGGPELMGMEVIMEMEKQNKLKKAKQILRKFPERSDFEEGAAFGMMTLQLYYNISYDVSI